MNTTTSDAPVPARDTTVAAPRQPIEARSPVGLWILLGVLAALAVNIAVVLYLASQMPT